MNYSSRTTLVLTPTKKQTSLLLQSPSKTTKSKNASYANGAKTPVTSRFLAARASPKAKTAYGHPVKDGNIQGSPAAARSSMLSKVLSSTALSDSPSRSSAVATPPRKSRSNSASSSARPSPLTGRISTGASPKNRTPVHKKTMALKSSGLSPANLPKGILDELKITSSAALSPSLKSGWNSPRCVGPAGVSPGFKRLPSKSHKTYDRFIPSRSAMDLASAQFSSIKEPKISSLPRQHLDPETLAYQEEMAKACGLALDQRILAFKAEPPMAQKSDLRTTWNRPLRNPNLRTAKRKIPTAPEKVLDAPGMVDDYYLNLLDWSSRNMLAVGLENTVYLWDANSGSVQEFLTTNENDPVTSLQWTLDGSYLAVGLNSGDTQIWDADSASKIRSMKGHAARVGVLSWDKHLVSSGCRDGSIWNHDVRIAKHKVAEMINHSAEVCGLKWRPDGQLLASGGNDNMVNIWDARSSTPKMTKGIHQAAVKAIAWCPWQLNLLCTGGGSNDKNIHFWNTTTGGKTATIATESQVTSLHWSKEYKEIVSTHGFPNNHISIWSYPSLNKVADLEGHDMRILHSSLSPDGQTLATCASDESLKFWKVFEKKPKNRVKRDADADDLSLATSRLTLR